MAVDGFVNIVVDSSGLAVIPMSFNYKVTSDPSSSESMMFAIMDPLAIAVPVSARTLPLNEIW